LAVANLLFPDVRKDNDYNAPYLELQIKHGLGFHFLYLLSFPVLVFNTLRTGEADLRF